MSQATAAIVASGTRRTEGTQWNAGVAWTDDDVVPVTMGGTTRSVGQSDLARMLDLRAPEPPTGLAGIFAGVLIVGGIGLAGLAILFTVLAAPSLDLGTIAVTLSMGLVCGAAFGFVPILVGWACLNAARGGRERWQSAHEAWEAAVPIAERLVYCRRDHVVYDPANAGHWLHPTHVRSYCLERGAAEQRR